MIKKLVRQMLAAQTISALTVSLCLLIDNIIIGRFLGDHALTAYELANPILLIIAALGSMLGAGIQMACSRSLGRGSQEETNEGFSSAIAAATVVSVVFTILVLLFSKPLSTLMGASDLALINDTGAYMSGFIIGAPASMGALILVPFLLAVRRAASLLCCSFHRRMVFPFKKECFQVFSFPRSPGKDPGASERRYSHRHRNDRFGCPGVRYE